MPSRQTADTIAAFLPSAWNREWLFAVLLACAALLAYQPAWNGKPIWDDEAHFTASRLHSVDGLLRIWSQPGAAQQYYPLVHSVFWLEHRMWGQSTLGYHLVNILLHVCSALLFLKILKRLEVPGAYLAAAIFLLHPVHVESVAWISELKNTLSGVFYLGSALAYLKFDRDRGWKLHTLALGLFVLGLMSKTVIATLPAALLVVLWWKRGRLCWKKDVVPLIPFFLAGIAAGLLTLWVERRFIGARGSAFGLPIVERFLIAGRAFWFYLGKLCWPAGLVFIYPRWDVRQTVWWQYLFPAAALLLLVVLWGLSRRNRGPLAAMLLFAGTLFPALGFFNVYPFRYSFVADHFQYMASLGAISLAAVGVVLLLSRWRLWGREWGNVLCLALLGVLACLTWRQSGMYRDVETLWRTTLAKNPDCSIAYNNLGNIVFQTGQVDVAMAYFQKAAELQPDNGEAHNNLGYILLQRGRLDEAISHLKKAVEVQPGFAATRYNLAVALVQEGQVDEAMTQYRKALEIQPDSAEANYNLGALLQEKGRLDEAMVHYQRALAAKPDFAQADNNLGNVLLQMGRLDEAVHHYQKALEVQPESALTHFNLGVALVQVGRVDEAITHYRRALEIRPDSAEVHYNLGNALRRKGRAQEAVAQYRAFLELQPDNADGHKSLAWLLATCAEASVRNGGEAVRHAEWADQLAGGRDPAVLGALAAAYAEAGRFREAVATAQRALQLAIAQRNAELADVLRTDIGSYQAGSPVRDSGQVEPPAERGRR